MFETTEKRIEYFRSLAVGFDFEHSIDIEALIETGYFDAPASLHHHGQHNGDLYHHSLHVAELLVTLTSRNDLTWQRAASPWIVGLLHDLCKADDYTLKGTRWDWNDKSIYSGHGEKSVLMMAPIIQLTEEEVACIRWHMGAFDEKENWNRYGAAVQRWSNVLWTHTADMIAARVEGV